MSKIKTLASSSTCGPCMVIKKKLQALGIEVPIKDASKVEDHEFFKKHNIKSVPRLVVEDGEEVTVIQGYDDIIAELERKED